MGVKHVIKIISFDLKWLLYTMYMILSHRYSLFSFPSLGLGSIYTYIKIIYHHKS